MYTVYAGTRLLYHPKLVEDGFVIYNPVVTLEANKSGSFQFTMPVTNSAYNFLEKMKTVITVYNDGEEIFRGRILNDERDFYNNKVIYCEGEMAFLLDSVIRPYKPESPQSIRDFLVDILAMHNSQVDEFKRFTMGECDIGTEQLHRWPVQDYTSTWGVIQGLLDYFGGYIRTRLTNGVRYFDYISSYNHTNTQVVAFGENLLDISHYISAENVITTLIPLGIEETVDMTNSEIQQEYPWRKAYVVSEPFSCLDKSDSPAYIFTLEVILDSQYTTENEEEVSHVTVSGKIRTVSGERSWSGLDGNQIQANLKMRIRNASRYVDERNQIVAQLKLGSTNVPALRNGKITTTDQEILRFSGDVDRGNLGVTLEFVNRYTRSTNGAKKAPISCAVGANANLYAHKNVRLTIEDADDSGGLDYITNTTTEALFGKIVGTQTWDYIDDPNELYDVAVDYLNNNVRMNVKLDINAMDLNLLNVAYEKFKIGDTVRVVSAPHSLDDEFVCTKITLDLQNPENNMYSLGHEFMTLTDVQITAAKDIQVTNGMLEQINNSLDAAETVVEQINQLVNTIYDKYADITTVINNLDAAYADIDFANIANAAITNLIANTAILTMLDAAYADIGEARITELTVDEVVAGLISTASLTAQELDAVYATIATLQADYITARNIRATYATIATLQSDYITAQNIRATYATIATLQTDYLTAAQIRTDYLDATEIRAAYATLNELHTDYIDANTIAGNYMNINFANISQAAINNLTANTFFANFMNGNYATISLANINTAAVRKMLGATGVFNNLTVNQDLTVAGQLNVALIAAGTILAEKLLLRGTDGLYYQLNITKKNELKDEAETQAEKDAIEAEWTRLDQDELKKTLHGENIYANTITAKQIAAGTITAQELAILNASQVTFQNGGNTLTMAGFIADVNGISSTVSQVESVVDDSVHYYTVRYFKSTSATSQPSDSDFDGASGSDTMPAREAGKYIWRRTTQTKNDGTSSNVYEMIQGADGASGGRGNGIYKVTTAPSSYTTTVGDFSPKYRIALSTVMSQAGVTEVLVGDIIEYSYYHYPVGYVDATYVYTGTRTSIRGVGSYTFWGYAPTNDTTLNDMTPAPRADTKYIGVVSQSSSTRPTTKSSYTWSEYVGDDGIGISKMEQLWYLKDTITDPNPPSSPTPLPITETANRPGIWTLTVPSYIDGYTYYTSWQTTYTDTPATVTASVPQISNELNEVHRDITQNSTLISQKADSITLSAYQNSVEENFAIIDGRIADLDNTYQTKFAALEVLPGEVNTIAQDYVTRTYYDEDTGKIKNEIDSLQTGLLTVESDGITAVVGDISKLNDGVSDLSQAFQVKADGTYIYEATIKQKQVTTLFYRSTYYDYAHRPEKPTALVTSTSTAAGQWTTVIPVSGDYYYWSCTQTNFDIQYGDSLLPPTWSEPHVLKERPSETSTKTVPFAQIVPNGGYLKNSVNGMEIYVANVATPVGWHTVDGIGGPGLSIGQSMDTTERWQFVMNGDLLNISWHE